MNESNIFISLAALNANSLVVLSSSFMTLLAPHSKGKGKAQGEFGFKSILTILKA